MTENKNTTKMNIHPVAGALIGALVGAGIGVVGAIALRDNKTRTKVEEVLKTVGDNASQYIDTIKVDATEELQDAAEETVADLKKVVSKKTK